MAKKKIIKHLKGDIENFLHEIKEDKKLIKSLKKSKNSKLGKKGGKKKKC